MPHERGQDYSFLLGLLTLINVLCLRCVYTHMISALHAVGGGRLGMRLGARSAAESIVLNKLSCNHFVGVSGRQSGVV